MFYTGAGRRQHPREVVPRFGLRPTPPIATLFLAATLLLAGGCGGAVAPSPSASGAASVISSEFGRVWGRLPADFPLLAGGQPLKRLDVISSGAIWSALGVEEATSAAADELRRGGWEVAAPLPQGDAQRLGATRDGGACALTIVVEPFGARTSLVVYLGEGCPQP